VKAHYENKNEEIVSSGDITYRFMLGKDITIDYNAERNYHYKLTLFFKYDANDVDWRIEYKEEPGIYVPNPEAGAYSLLPAGFISTDFSALGETFGQCFTIDLDAVGIFNFIVIIFAFLFVDLFDTLGTLIGVATKADMLDENGRLPKIKPALMSDAIATSAGAILGTSTTTTFVESSAGVAIGGRTGLTALTTGVLFLLATLFSPLFTSIPAFATAPALIFVGFLMFEAVLALKFDADSLTDTIPAYICILAMPLFYSISEGICFGVISYVVIKMATGKAKEVAPLMYVLAVLFVLKYIFL
jgi:AGZA family xanthine/uracil permease-like MFS transporter